MQISLGTATVATVATVTVGCGHMLVLQTPFFFTPCKIYACFNDQ